MTRSNPRPPADRTLHCLGDLHVGATPLPQFDATRQSIVAADLARAEMPQPEFRLQLGDLTETGTSAQDAAGVAYMASLGGTPLFTVGNHDIWGGVRDAEAAAAAWGLPAKDYVTDLGYANLIVLGPDDIQPVWWTGLYYYADTLAWLDAQLAASTKPCLVAAHPPLKDTVGVGQDAASGARSPTFGFYAMDDAAIRAVLAAHDNAVAWIGGHTHSPITAPWLVKAEPVGARTLASINTSSLAYTGPTKTDWTSRLVTVWVTVEADRLEVRFRDHGAHQWVGGSAEGYRAWTFAF